MLIAADYPFLDVFWSMIVFFAWLAWIWIAITCFSDILRRHDIGGWHKAAWVVFIIVIPFLGVLVYLIAQHDGMRDRTLAQAKAQQAAMDQYVRRYRRWFGDRDREGEGAARQRSDHPAGVRCDQGEGAQLDDVVARHPYRGRDRATARLRLVADPGSRALAA